MRTGFWMRVGLELDFLLLFSRRVV
jgi:hypothetical protein